MEYNIENTNTNYIIFFVPSLIFTLTIKTDKVAKSIRFIHILLHRFLSFPFFLLLQRVSTKIQNLPSFLLLSTSLHCTYLHLLFIHGHSSVPSGNELHLKNFTFDSFFAPGASETTCPLINFLPFAFSLFPFAFPTSKVLL